MAKETETFEKTKRKSSMADRNRTSPKVELAVVNHCSSMKNQLDT